LWLRVANACVTDVEICRTAEPIHVLFDVWRLGISRNGD